MGPNAISDVIRNALAFAVNFVQTVHITDIIDILIVAVMIYYFMMMIRGTRAVQLVKGIGLVAAIYYSSYIFRLNTLNTIMRAVVNTAIVAVIVIFQPELRQLLEQMGRLKLVHFLGFAPEEGMTDEAVVANIATAASNMAKTKTGALIVIERGTRLGEYMHSGTRLDADVTSELLENIFVPNTPLHDGAVIIRGDKIINAGCVLPLTANSNLSSELGTRHRAALGLSEASDAVIVVVSEETGKISVAMNGSLTRNLSASSLKKALGKVLSVNESASGDAFKKTFIRKIK
ncbi:MAG: diadenylate cyclase CdaA [Clostridia bacterium]|nr:diadenylate cyclase CdaA [Clostridia bacterium]